MSALDTLVAIGSGGTFGALLRLVPEGFKLFTESANRKHELSIMDRQLAQQKAGHQQRMDEIRLTSDAQSLLLQLQGSVDATKATGIWIVDVLNGLFRPVVSFWMFGLYATYRTATIVLAIVSGWKQGDWSGALTALTKVWTVEDAAMLAGIFAFWFLNRSLPSKGK